MVKRGNVEYLRSGRLLGPVSHLESGLRVSWLPGRTGLAAAGEVDVATHRGWRSTLELLLVDGIPGRLDLSGLTFIDGHGTAALVGLARRMGPDRRLTLYRPPYCLRRVLDLFWSDVPLEIEDEDEEAG